jgi:hypothetical protein
MAKTAPKELDSKPGAALLSEEGASGKTSVGIDVSHDQDAEKRPGKVEILPPPSASRSLTQVDATRRDLDAATTVPEVKAIHDKAAGLSKYAKLAQNCDLLNDATEIMLVAQRKLGQILIDMAAKGERASGHGDQKSEFRKGTPKLEDLGIDKKQSFRCRELAKLTEDKFKSHVEARKKAVIEVAVRRSTRAAAIRTASPPSRPRKKTLALKRTKTSTVPATPSNPKSAKPFDDEPEELSSLKDRRFDPDVFIGRLDGIVRGMRDLAQNCPEELETDLNAFADRLKAALDWFDVSHASQHNMSETAH